MAARAEVISYTEQKAAKVDEPGAVPMELDAFKGKKGAKGGGKTASKAKGGGGNPDKDVVCHLCKKKGHRKSACWYAKENGGTGKPPLPKEPKEESPQGANHPKGRAKVAKVERREKERPTPLRAKGLRTRSGQARNGQKRSRAMVSSASCVCWVQVSLRHWNHHGPQRGRSADLPLVLPRGPGRSLGRLLWPSAWGKEDSGELLFWCPCPGCQGQKRRYSSNGLSQHLWTKVGQEGHPVESQFGAWDQEAKKGFYVRPELPETRGSLAHCGSEPTWIYLPEEPDYSKHRPEPEDFGEEAGDSEAESDDAPVEVQEEEQEEAAPVEKKKAEAARVEDEQETVMQQRASELLQLQTAAARRRKGQRAAAAEAARAETQEKAEEVESSVSDEAWKHWKPAKKDRLKGTPARVEPDGDLHQHRYGKVPARAKKSQGTPPIPEESPPRPRRAKKSRDTSPPEESSPSPRRAKKSPRHFATRGKLTFKA